METFKSKHMSSAYFLLSKSNSLRFAKRIKWGDCSNYKNDENTLSHEADVPLAYTEIQQFQSCDKIITQFKSNYKSVAAFVITESGKEVPLIISKKTSNQGLKDKRDAILTATKNRKTGIYYKSGKTYNYDTDAVTGNYTLNGGLPEYAIIGNYVTFWGKTLPIEDIIYNERLKADVLVIDSFYLDVDIETVVSAAYDRIGYEVYEFEIDMVNYLNQKIRVKIINRDDLYENIEYLSELIDIKIKQENTIEIRYKNNTNTDIYYTSGIENKLRLPLKRKDGKISDESETHKTDTSTVLIRSEIHELDEFIFEPVTKEIMRKLVQALSHSDIIIDGVSYVKNDSIGVEGALEDTNLYIVKATMIKARNVYDSSNSENEFFGDLSEVPNLIESDQGFVRY